jgi:hypothetical protein
MWTFLSCPAPGGGKPIDRFIADLGPEAENDLTAILEELIVLERRFWTRPQFDQLHGDRYRGMGEIRFDGERKAYRLFGYFGPFQMHFTFLHGCEKKRSLKSEMDHAAKRRDFAKANQDALYAFTFEANTSRET